MGNDASKASVRGNTPPDIPSPLPAELSYLRGNLETKIDLSYQLYKTLPLLLLEHRDCAEVRALSMTSCGIESARGLDKLTGLRHLDLSCNNIRRVPSEAGMLNRLSRLDLRHNGIVDLPITIGVLSALTSLQLSFNLLSVPPMIEWESDPLSTLTSSLSGHHHSVSAAMAALTTLLPARWRPASLKHSASVMENTELGYWDPPDSQALPDIPGSDECVRRLARDGAGVDAQSLQLNEGGFFSSCVFGPFFFVGDSSDIFASTESVNSVLAFPGVMALRNSVFRNDETSFSAYINTVRFPYACFDLVQMHSLTSLDLSYNCLTSLPSVLHALPCLASLNVAHNRIREIPEWVAALTNLTFLDLSNNSIAEIPPSLQRLTSLVELDVHCQQLEQSDGAQWPAMLQAVRQREADQMTWRNSAATAASLPLGVFAALFLSDTAGATKFKMSGSALTRDFVVPSPSVDGWRGAMTVGGIVDDVLLAAIREKHIGKVITRLSVALTEGAFATALPPPPPSHRMPDTPSTMPDTSICDGTCILYPPLLSLYAEKIIGALVSFELRPWSAGFTVADAVTEVMRLNDATPCADVIVKGIKTDSFSSVLPTLAGMFSALLPPPYAIDPSLGARYLALLQNVLEERSNAVQETSSFLSIGDVMRLLIIPIQESRINLLHRVLQQGSPSAVLARLPLEGVVALRPARVQRYLASIKAEIRGRLGKNDVVSLSSFGNRSALAQYLSLTEIQQLVDLVNGNAPLHYGMALRSMTCLRRLRLSSNSLMDRAMWMTADDDDLPWLSHLVALTDLDISDNALSEIPPSLRFLTQLRHLNASNNAITALLPSLCELPCLEVLELSDNRLQSLPSLIGRLTTLKRLTVRNNHLKTIPASIGALTLLQDLDVSDNDIRSLPVELGLLENLERFRFSSRNGLLRDPPLEVQEQGRLAVLAYCRSKIPSAGEPRSRDIVLPVVLLSKRRTRGAGDDGIRTSKQNIGSIRVSPSLRLTDVRDVIDLCLEEAPLSFALLHAGEVLRFDDEVSLKLSDLLPSKDSGLPPTMNAFVADDDYSNAGTSLMILDVTPPRSRRANPQAPLDKQLSSLNVGSRRGGLQFELATELVAELRRVNVFMCYDTELPSFQSQTTASK